MIPFIKQHVFCLTDTLFVTLIQIPMIGDAKIRYSDTQAAHKT